MKKAKTLKHRWHPKSKRARKGRKLTQAEFTSINADLVIEFIRLILSGMKTPNTVIIDVEPEGYSYSAPPLELP